MTTLDKEITEIEELVDKIGKHLEGLESLPDSEVQKLLDLLQHIEDKLVGDLARFGVEVGDERVD